MSFEQVKKVAAEFALDKAIDYVVRDPEKNLLSLLDFAERLASRPEHKETVQSLRQHFKDNPGVMKQAKRLLKNPKMLSNFMRIWVGSSMLVGKTVREQLSKELGVSVPTLIVIDPTAACNLRCEGCWAGEYNKAESLEPELFDRILREAKELGIYWIVLSGGEPFAYPHLLDIVEKHQDMAFMSYTNGTLIDEEKTDRLAQLANFSPAISLEGWEEQTDARRGKGTFKKVMKTMDLLRERGVAFGASVTATRNNVEELFSEKFIDFLVEKGAVYMWSFHYIPVGRSPNPDLMLRPEQRAWLAREVPRLRKEKPILIADFWNDGEATQGCIAGGRIYFHISAAGDVEPCAFAHFAVGNIREQSLKEAIQNPLFKAYQKRQPFNTNHLAPCPIIDNPEILREIVEESKALPTHEGADSILSGELGGYLDKISEQWRQEADKVSLERK